MRDRGRDSSQRNRRRRRERWQAELTSQLSQMRKTKKKRETGLSWSHNERAQRSAAICEDDGESEGSQSPNRLWADDAVELQGRRRKRGRSQGMVECL
jgi:hypothetical protein